MTAWATVEQARARVAVPTAVDDERLGRALDAASEILEQLSGVRPVETLTVEPEPCGCGVRLTGAYPAADLPAAGVSGGSPFWWRVGGDLIVGDRLCGCALVLPHNPVLAVEAVVVDGVTQDPGTYRLVDANRLERLGGAFWGVRTLAVTYRAGGAGLGEAALRAVSKLAVELAKSELPASALGGDRCELPARVTSVTRAGVTVALLDPQTFLTEGRTGLYLVDLFLAAYAPSRSAVSVTSPDDPRFLRRRTP